MVMVVMMVAFAAAAAFTFFVIMVMMVAFAAAAAFTFFVIMVMMVAFAAAAAFAFLMIVVMMVMTAATAAAFFVIVVMMVMTAATAAAFFLIVMMVVTAAAATAFFVIVVMMVMTAATAAAFFLIVMMVVTAAAATAFFTVVMMVMAAATATTAASGTVDDADRIEPFFDFGDFKTDHREHLRDVFLRNDGKAPFGFGNAHAAVDQGARRFTHEVEVARDVKNLFHGRTNRPEFALFVHEHVVDFKHAAFRHAEGDDVAVHLHFLRPFHAFGQSERKRVRTVKNRLGRSSFGRKQFRKSRHD